MYSDEYIKSFEQGFPSPFGDKLKFTMFNLFNKKSVFPSPYGATPLYHGGGKIEIPFQGEP